MPPTATASPPTELLRKVRRIQIRTSHRVSDALAGQYHSAFKGRGMQFEEVRPYLPGDDVRSIDWNVSARFGEPFIKLFREERELTVVIAADLSASESFGTRSQLKRDLVAEIGATLAYSAIRNNDKVALLLFTDRVERYLPPRKGPRHVLRVLRDLVAYEPMRRGTALGHALEELNRIVRRRSVVFLLSDFLDDGYESPLRIARSRHDLIPVVVSDRHELELPPVGIVEFRDPESGRTFFADTSSRRFRNRYAELVARRRERRDRLFRAVRCEPIEVRTGEDIVGPLTRYFRRRERRP